MYSVMSVDSFSKFLEHDSETMHYINVGLNRFNVSLGTETLILQCFYWCRTSKVAISLY